MLKFFKSKETVTVAAPVEEVTVAKTVSYPMTINPDDEQKIAHAKYRVDAIQRYLTQCLAEGVVLSEDKLIHLKAEQQMYRALLAMAKVTN